MVLILITGGRDYARRDRLYRVLDAAVSRLGLTEIVHGDAPGADTLAKEWARDRGVGQRPFPANWSDLSHPGARIKQRPDGTKYDALAGHRRNQQMLDQCNPIVAIAFPGGSGTADMIARARKAGVTVHLIDWDGKTR